MKDSITLKQWLPLLGITCSAFVFNTSEFMPIGLLGDISGGFGLTEAECGLMISVYAWGVMVLSLPLMIFASRFDFKRLLLAVVALFAAGQFLSALAPTFAILTLARLVVAAAHAVFWSIAPVMASRLVDARHGAFALSMVVTGTSIAQIFGLPLGRAVGLVMGWRMTFALVGAVACAILVYQAVFFPKMPAGERFTLKRLPDLIKNPVLMSLYVVVVLMAGGYYTGYSYIEPFLGQVGGIEPASITAALTVFGAAGLLGSFAFSRLFDAHRALFFGSALAGMAAALLLMVPASISFASVVALCVLWGASATAFNVAYQSEIIRYTDEGSSSVAMAIGSGIYNLGIGSGTAIGGAITSAVSVAGVGVGGALISGAGLLVGVLAFLPASRRFLEERA